MPPRASKKGAAAAASAKKQSPKLAAKPKSKPEVSLDPIEETGVQDDNPAVETETSQESPELDVPAKITETSKSEPEVSLNTVEENEASEENSAMETETSQKSPEPEVPETEFPEQKVEEASGEVQGNEEAKADADQNEETGNVAEDTGIAAEEDAGMEEGEDTQAGEDANACPEEEGVGDGDSDHSASENEEGDEAGEANEDEEEGDEAGEANEDEEDPSVYMQAPMTERKKQKEFEIFVGGLDKEAVEEDLIKIFAEFGEIQAVRIVKNPVNQKSKGFAFVRYATVEQAEKALAELKEPEVRGKKIRISASQDNDTLYVGNICKTWTKDKVLETLKGYGVEQIEEMILPDDPKNEGQSKGFVLLEFTTHSGAVAAFQRLRKPDAIFGCTRSASVSFAQSSMHPNEEALSKVKTVYVEGLVDSWDEEKVKEHCKKYGEIEKVQLSRNFTSAKRKDYGFIAFTTRESALACVDGINSAEIGDGEVKVKANIARPLKRGRPAKKGIRGGFKVNKDGESTEGAGRQGRSKTEGRNAKDIGTRGTSRSKSKGAKGGKQLKTEAKTAAGGEGDTPSKTGKPEDRQKKAPANKKDMRGGKRKGADNSGPPPKKLRDNRNARGRPNRDFGNRRNPRSERQQQASYPRGGPYASSSYSGVRDRAYSAVAGSKRRHSDLEPHAGYLEPAAKQSRAPTSYGQSRRSSGYDSQRRSSTGHGGIAPPPMYAPDYSVSAGYEGGYGYSRSSAYVPRRRGAYY